MAIQLNSFQTVLRAPYASIGSLLATKQEEGRLNISSELLVLSAEGLQAKEYKRISKVFNAKVKITFIITAISFLSTSSFSQTDSLKKIRTKKILFTTSVTSIAAGSLVYLNQIWYKPYSTANFHFFNDNSEWLQMDKVGHSWTTYQTACLMMEAMQRSGFSRKKSMIIGESIGFTYETAVEVMDGFSSGWGFSWGDISANFSGAALAITQQYFWDEQRIKLKYSFHQTSYAKYRPSELGSYLLEETIKDYNGQSYWLSLNVASFLNKTSNFPKWLNVAFGYGAEDMISGQNNYFIIDPHGKTIGQNRYRKYFFSLDIDFSKIKTKSKVLKSIFSVINCFKVPFPSIELNKHGTFFRPFYY